jgi:hypothetical protein
MARQLITFATIAAFCAVSSSTPTFDLKTSQRYRQRTPDGTACALPRAVSVVYERDEGRKVNQERNRDATISLSDRISNAKGDQRVQPKAVVTGPRWAAAC